MKPPFLPRIVDVVATQEADFVAFMKDPQNPMASLPPPPPPPDQLWADVAGAEHLVHLTQANFDSFVAEHASVLVMFYAPCKFSVFRRRVLRSEPVLLHLQEAQHSRGTGAF